MSRIGTAAAASREFELRHWRSRPKSLSIPPRRGDDDVSYTSLRDVIGQPSGSESPSPAGGEIRIRNRLLNKAACAYLQPTPSASEPSRRRQFSIRRTFGECLGFVECFFFWRIRVGERSRPETRRPD